MSECPHKQLKKQMVGEQVWYACECGQKFRVEPWDGRVRVVEGLKVEEGREPQPWWMEGAKVIGTCVYKRTENGIDVSFERAAQHLKREQEPDCPRCGSDSRNIEITCVHCGYLFAAAQPPQELASLREALQSVIDERDTELDMMHCPYTNGTREHDAWHQGVREAWERFDVVKRKARAALTRGAVGE